MFTRASNSLDIGFWGKFGARSNHLPRLRSTDADLAALGVPALVLSALMIGIGLAALLPLGDWARDYGLFLVIAAYVMYMSLAVALGIWGFRLIHDRRQPSSIKPPIPDRRSRT